MLKKYVLLILLIPFITGNLFASGFSIYEQGARATAMGGAYIAQANDATAVFYNPAGFANLSGTNFTIGTTLIATQFAFTGPTYLDDRKYTAAKDGFFPPSHLYITYRIHDRVSAGFGFFSLFGLGSEWGSENDPWVGRLLTTNTELQTYFFNPQIAVKILENLSVGAGFEIVNGSVKMERDLYFSPRNVFGSSTLKANTQGYGFNLGIKYEPLPGLMAGAIYRSNVNLDFEDGDATYDFPDTGDDVINGEIRRYFPFKTKGSSKIELPDVLGAGIAYEFTENLLAEFDYLLIRWSSYDKLTVKFQQSVVGVTQVESPRNYRDSYSLRFGMQYRLDESWNMRLGYIYDQYAVPEAYVEPSLPEGNRHNYTFGIGYKWSTFSVDGAYHLLLQDDREVTNSIHNFNGKYTGLANLYSLSLGFVL